LGFLRAVVFHECGAELGQQKDSQEPGGCHENGEEKE
jgi:hypothetical protein